MLRKDSGETRGSEVRTARAEKWNPRRRSSVLDRRSRAVPGRSPADGRLVARRGRGLGALRGDVVGPVDVRLEVDLLRGGLRGADRDLGGVDRAGDPVRVGA